MSSKIHTTDSAALLPINYGLHLRAALECASTILPSEPAQDRQKAVYSLKIEGDPRYAFFLLAGSPFSFSFSNFRIVRYVG